jgi:hypothetical protein
MRTEEILEILNKRRLMTTEAAPIATEKPICSFVASGVEAQQQQQQRFGSSASGVEVEGLTDVAPDGGNVAGVVVPYELVDEDERVAERGPGDVEDRARIPRLEMRGGCEGEEDEAEADDDLVVWRVEVAHDEAGDGDGDGDGSGSGGAAGAMGRRTREGRR